MRRILVQGIMRTNLMVIANVITNKPPKVFLVQRNHMVEQLPATTSYPTLRDSILPGCLCAGPFEFQSGRLQKIYDVRIEFRIVVQDHITGWATTGESLPQLLDDPLWRRMRGHVEVQDL